MKKFLNKYGLYLGLIWLGLCMQISADIIRNKEEKPKEVPTVVQPAEKSTDLKVEAP